MESDITLYKYYEINLKLSEREISMLQALFGIKGLSDYLGDKYVEYKKPSKEFFKEMSKQLRFPTVN